MQKQQNGFAILEIIMGIAIIALVGVVAYLGVQTYSKSTTKVDDSAAATIVGEFYSKYYDLFNIPTTTPDSALANNSFLERHSAVAQYGTTSFIKAYSDTMIYNAKAATSDHVLCVNDDTIGTVTKPIVISHKLIGNKASVKVQDTPQDSPTANVMDVSVIYQNGLKIDSVTCHY